MRAVCRRAKSGRMPDLTGRMPVPPYFKELRTMVSHPLAKTFPTVGIQVRFFEVFLGVK
jgi:hypothetical protein